MGDAAAGGPAVVFQHVERAQVFDEAVAEGAVELQPVAVGAHAAVADEVAGVLHGEQVFARGHGALVHLAEFGLQFVVERVAGLFVPEQGVLREGLAVVDGGWQVEAAVGVHGELLAGAEDFQDGFDALAVVGQRGAPIFILTTE